MSSSVVTASRRLSSVALGSSCDPVVAGSVARPTGGPERRFRFGFGRFRRPATGSGRPRLPAVPALLHPRFKSFTGGRRDRRRPDPTRWRPAPSARRARPSRRRPHNRSARPPIRTSADSSLVVVLCRPRCPADRPPRSARRARATTSPLARASPQPTRPSAAGASASSRPRRASSRRRRASSMTPRRRARPATQRGGPRRDTTRPPRRATDPFPLNPPPD